MKTSERLWQYHRAKLSFNNDCTIIDFYDNNNGVSLKFKQKLTGQTSAKGTKDVGITVPLKYLDNL